MLYKLFKVMGYPLNNFVGTNFHCLEKQPYCVGFATAFKLLCKESMDAVDKPLDQVSTRQSYEREVTTMATVSVQFVSKNSDIGQGKQPFYGFASTRDRAY